MRKSNYRPKPNYLWSILSVAVVLTFLATFLFLTMQSHDLVERIKGSYEVVAEFDPAATQSEQDYFADYLRKDSSVAASSIALISKEDALISLSSEMGIDLDDVGEVNPLFDAVKFQMTSDHSSSAAVEDLQRRAVQEHRYIVDFHYQGGLMDQLISNVERLKWVFILVGAILIFLALALIFNSIRLALYANRFLIKNMELVGASWNFIRKPFLKRSFRHSLLSCLLCGVFLVTFLTIVRTNFPEVDQYLRWDRTALLASAVVAISLLINLGSTFYVVTKYLSMPSRNLY